MTSRAEVTTKFAREYARAAKKDKGSPVSYDRDGQNVEGEEFVAKKIGHDIARTRYDVDRTPRRAAVEREAAAFEAPHRPAPAAQSSPLSL